MAGAARTARPARVPTQAASSRRQVERLNEALGSDPNENLEPADGSLDLPKKTDPAVQGHPAASDLRETARATRTEPREDPSPAEATLSANAKAYEDDLRNFR